MEENNSKKTMMPGKGGQPDGVENVFGVSTAAAATSSRGQYEAGKALLQTMGCARGLAGTLTNGPDGRPHVPIQLQVLDKEAQPTALAQTMAYLSMTQPAGGHEPIIAANRDAARERAGQAILDRLTDTGGGISFAALLKETREAAREEKTAVDMVAVDLQDRYAGADAVLRKYHDESASGSAEGGGLFGALKRAIGGYVRLSEAVRAFNEREQTNMALSSHEAASQVLAHVMAMCERLLGGIEATRAAALSGMAQAQERERLLGQASSFRRRSADYAVSSGDVIDMLCEGEGEEAFLPELMARAREQGGDAVSEMALEIAERVTRRQLQGLSLVDLIKLEAARASAAGRAINADAAPLLVGMRLLDLTRRARPGARLTDTARGADFILQICPGETPLFYNANLVTAHFRNSSDEFAFMRVQTDLSVEELQVAREGGAELDAALERREFFVLEDLVLAHRKAKEQSKVVRGGPVPDPDVTARDEFEVERSPNGSAR